MARKRTQPAARPSGTRYRLDRGEKNIQTWYSPGELAVIDEAARLDGRSRAGLAKQATLEEARRIVAEKNPKFLAD